MNAIADNLKRLRLGAGLSQVALAKKAKVSQQLISQLEAGTNASTKQLPALANALGVAVDQLDPSYGVAADNSTEAHLASDGEEAIRVQFTFIGGDPSPADQELFRRLAKASPSRRRGLLEFLRGDADGDDSEG